MTGLPCGRVLLALAALWLGGCATLSPQQRDAFEELPELIRRGVPTFKAFMVYDFAVGQEDLPRLMGTAARNGGMLMLHCEDPAIIDPRYPMRKGKERLDPPHLRFTQQNKVVHGSYLPPP